MIESVLVGILDRDVLLGSFTLYREYRSVLASVEHIEPVYLLACADGFNDRITTFYGIFIYFAVFLFLRHSLLRSL